MSGGFYVVFATDFDLCLNSDCIEQARAAIGIRARIVNMRGKKGTSFLKSGNMIAGNI